MRATTIALVCAGLSGLAAAPSFGMGQTTEIGTVPGRHEVVANCLMRHLPPGLQGWPSVSPPPRRDAIVNVFKRGTSSVTPVAVFHLRGTEGGLVTVAVEKPSNAAMASAVVKRCD